MSCLSQKNVFFYICGLALFWKTTSKRVADETRKQLENRSKIDEKSSPKRSKFEASLQPLRRRLSGTILERFSDRFWDPLGDFWRPEGVQDDVREKTENWMRKKSRDPIRPGPPRPGPIGVVALKNNQQPRPQDSRTQDPGPETRDQRPQG